MVDITIPHGAYKPTHNLAGGHHPEGEGNKKDLNWTPLHLAAHGGHTSTVELLLSRGAKYNPKAGDGGDIGDYRRFMGIDLFGFIGIYANVWGFYGFCQDFWRDLWGSIGIYG